MDSARFQLEDTTKPVFLHFEYKKFWSVTLNGNFLQKFKSLALTFETIIKCGKLDDDGHEDASSVQAHNKEHGSFSTDKINFLISRRGQRLHREACEYESFKRI